MSKNLLDALRAIRKEDRVSAHMPGHKYGGCGLKERFNDFWDIDITEIPDADNLHDPEGILLEAQTHAAVVYGAKESFFLVNGSSCGIMAMLMGSLKRGDQIIVTRDAHRSVHQGILLGGLKPIYVSPEIDEASGVVIGLGVQTLSEALMQYPNVKAVMLTYPAYSGACSDMEQIVAMARQKDILVLVDEAHGAHLWLHEALPQSALVYGADVVVQSLHKTMPALTQTAILHMGTTAVDRTRIKQYLAMLQTSSPSYLLMASIDEAVRIGKMMGTEAMASCMAAVRRLKARALALGYEVFDDQTLSGSRGFDLTKVCLSGRAMGLDGYELEVALRRKKVQVEYAQASHVLLMFTIANDKVDYERIERALAEISQEKVAGVAAVSVATYPMPKGIAESVLDPWEIADKASHWVNLADAENQICAEMVIPYPPGVPCICPGERVTQEAIYYIEALLASGHKVLGLTQNRIRILTV